MKKQNVSRRNFLKTVGVAGVGSVLTAKQGIAQTEPAAPAPPPTVPLRPFGKTGVKVSMLSLGGIFDITANQLVLQRALDFGVTYWDTANSYANGNSEKGIGMYFEKNPDARKKIFLVTKAGGSHSPEALNKMVDLSLERMKTDYIDLFFLHGVGDGGDLTSEVKAWAEKTKAAKKIRFFGFSSHGNMERTLQAAAKAGWVDGIMLKYDFRLMHTDEMKAAVDACEKAGIGLAAMKTQSKQSFNLENEADLKLGGHFVKSGFTEHQARLKAVWENPQISTICSQMPNVTILAANVAAALDKTKLTSADHSAFRQYAQETCSGYCAGCAHLCESALGHGVPVVDVMRSLMYYHGYNDVGLARETFAGIPQRVRQELAGLDYTLAERVCPNRLPIARLMREASKTLA
jgi:aryl-alcohol dehydrogenase-like predicted oxidoreductase